jgi:hypothetical protein
MTSNPAIAQGGCPRRGTRTRKEARVRPWNSYRQKLGASVYLFEVSSFFSDSLPALGPLSSGSMADRAVSRAATPAATAACLATRFSFDVLGRVDFLDFVGRFDFVCLRVFALEATRFELFFGFPRFDEVLELARFFAFYMIYSVRYQRLGFDPI